jgi:hypothetical protein
MKKNENASYLCNEFADILLNKYIDYSNPPLEIRINLLKQIVEFIIHFNNNGIILDDFDSNYIFIQGLENPTVKILHNCNNFNY